MSGIFGGAIRNFLYNVVVSTPLFARFMGWRRSRLKLDYVSRFGNRVASGPFTGMRLRPEFSELPKFLGTYEGVLNENVRGLLARHYDVVLNIGCAEGYYAVGVALALPNVRVEAFDLDPIQRARCQANADLNGVGDRIEIGAEFKGAQFGGFGDKRVLVICDIEGGEVDLIDPSRWRGLEAMDFLIELHEDRMEDMLGAFKRRFDVTHDLTYVRRQLTEDLAQVEKIFGNEMDQLAAIYENRFGPTAWLIALSRMTVATG
jgi:hypothetical protein